MDQVHSPHRQALTNQPLDQLKIKLCELIQYYQRQPSELLALSVVEHIEALYQYHDWPIPTNQWYAWKKVLRHWRCLAWTHHLRHIDNDYHLD